MKHLVFVIGLFTLALSRAGATADATINDFTPRAAGFNGNAIPYELFIPDGYNLPQNAGRTYPIIVFMCGKGDRGTDNVSQVTGAHAPVLGLLTGPNRDNYPAFVVCPQISTNFEWEWGGQINDVHHIIELLKGEFRIDTNRVYLTGLSLGAMGCWGQLMAYGNYYAAAAICSGELNDSSIVSGTNFAQTPLWVFHGTLDPLFNIGQPRARVAATRDAGGYVVYTEYVGVGHDENAWGSPGNGRGLCTPGLMKWLTSQVLGAPNTQAPFVAINSPANNSNTSATVVNASGIASDAVLGGGRAIQSLVWSNDRGGSGPVSGTDNWSVNTIPLSSGINRTQIIATDNQSTTFNQLLTINQVTDAIPPTLSIASPTSSSSFTTTSPTLDLAGVAFDNVAVTAISWSNDRGGSGPASGTMSWSASGIALFNGVNVLRVTAKDAANNIATAILTVTANLPAVNQKPVVNAGANQTITLPASATLTGTVVDDGLAPGSATPTAQWTKFSGPTSGVATFGNINAASTTVTFNLAGTYVLRLTGSDGVLTSISDVTITVNPLVSGNPPPIRFDFGGTIENATGAITAGNWNNVTTVAAGATITNAIDSNGAPTGLGLSVTTPFNGINYLGSTSNSGAYPPTAMQDNFFVQDAQIAKVKLTGLNPATTYTLIFFGCRVGGGTNRVTAYTVGGTTVTLDATDNILNTVAVTGVAPLTDGSIEMSVQNSVGSGYGYLGVLEVQPAPSVSHKTVQFDFGGTVPGATGAITPGNWNNVTTVNPGAKISDAIDTTGGSTGIALSVTSTFNNINYLGSISPSGLYPATAMQDSFFVQDAQVASVKLQGLLPSRTYTLTFFASRVGNGTNRVTAYTVGATTVTLDATDNTTTAVSIPNLTPLSDGTLEVSVKNQINSGYGYLGVLEVKW